MITIARLRNAVWLVSVFVIALPYTSFRINAYELITHGQMTQQAYLMSTLGKFDTQKRLGLDTWINGQFSTAPFGTRYFDLSNISGGPFTPNREGSDFEAALMPGGDRRRRPPRLSESAYLLNGWLMRGAIREDDFTPVTFLGVTLLGAPNPQDDPYGNINRPLNHFSIRITTAR
jgi:hypothetical protein